MLLYRYEDFPGESLSNCFMLLEFNVVHETKKCYRIDFDSCRRLSGEMEVIKKSNKSTKLVRKNGINVFAWDSKEKALRNYIARKKRQIDILESRLGMARHRKYCAENYKFDDQ